MELVVDLIGWLAAALLLLAYALLSARKLRSQSLTYQWMNIFGGGLLAVNTWYYGAIPSVLVNVVWVFIGLAALWRMRQGQSLDEHSN